MRYSYISIRYVNIYGRFRTTKILRESHYKLTLHTFYESLNVVTISFLLGRTRQLVIVFNSH